MSRPKYSFKVVQKLNKNGTTEKNVDMKHYNTFRCGGKASTFLTITTIESFVRVILYLKETKTKYFLLGGGSNLLVSDKGFDGVVIRLLGDFARTERLTESCIEFGAGVKLAEAYIYSRDLGLSGLECSAGIPATIGGAVFMNASAYQFEMSKLVKYVVAYVDGKIRYFDKQSCEFRYRHSVFQVNNAIILRVGLEFQKSSKEIVNKIYMETLNNRKKTQPIESCSAGCVFKKLDEINVSKLLDESGLKGLTLGDAAVSNKHANFIINLGEADSQDIFYLIELMKKRIKDKYNIDLETEIRFLGDFNETAW